MVMANRARVDMVEGPLFIKVNLFFLFDSFPFAFFILFYFM
jgi:hypothetical protein